MTTGYLDMDLLRFTTAGSVDDGKSTLIGRLLFDSKNIFEDQLEAVERVSEQRGAGYVDLALLTDGLRAEREQGITIDVAYRYFATPRRKFIIADTPGHIQYTRNMVTGASTANLAIVLVDARKGVIEQTCRHAFIANLLRIQHVVLAVNKMDLVDFAEDRFNEIVTAFKAFASRLDNFVEISFIPISALKGDNIVDKSANMPWYQGPTLLYHLETVYVRPDANHVDARFPIQYVIRPHLAEHHDFRGYAGRVAGGVFKPGDEVTTLPSGFTTRIKSVHLPYGDTSAGRPKDGQHSAAQQNAPTIDPASTPSVAKHSADQQNALTPNEAFHPLSVALTLEDEIDLSRGDMLVKANNPPQVSQDLEAMVCWFSADTKLSPNAKYLLRHTTREVRALVRDVRYKVDINTLHKIEHDHTLALNDIARLSLRTSAPLFYDSYSKNRTTGSFILIDEQTNATVAAGMIV